MARLYARFRLRYWHDVELPDFETLDFEFEDWPGEWGHVEWDAHGLPHLSLHPMTRKAPSVLRGTLIHEMCHLRLGPAKSDHGRDFRAEVDRIVALGAHHEFF